MADTRKALELTVDELIGKIKEALAPDRSASFAGSGDRLVTDGQPAPVVHAQRTWRTARDLKQVVDPAELARWWNEFGRQATPSLIGSLYVLEKDLPDDQMTKFNRR